MTNIEAYTTWAPGGALWTEWAKPVLFATDFSGDLFGELTLPNINWLSNFQQNTALIVDLPDKKGVEESLALAHSGYRPVPLYNGVCGENAISIAVDVRNLARALFAGTELLKTINIRGDAPPVFMLDSRRMDGIGKRPGEYDNRWCVFPQDMPSALFMTRHGINRVIVRTEQKSFSDKIPSDLSHILCRYQEAGIKICHTYGNDEVNDITVLKPMQFKSLFYRFRVIMGLSRNAAGGFGSKIPESGDGGGGRYYGIG